MKNRKSNSLDLTTGSVWGKYLSFVLPILASNLLQNLYNAADKAVVGQYAGDHALAAVGSTGSAINLLICLFTGLAIGANVVCANGSCYGTTSHGDRNRDNPNYGMYSSSICLSNCNNRDNCNKCCLL